jgi:hypothetical protein
VSIFRRERRSEPPEPAAPVPYAPWQGPPPHILGAGVPLDLTIARSDRALVAVTGLIAYPEGFEFILSARRRASEPGGAVAPLDFDDFGTDPDQLRYGVAFEDGARLTSIDSWQAHDGEEGGDAGLLPTGGSGSRARWDERCWVWPLAPPGPLTFTCSWPAAGIPESVATIDAAVVIEAAGRAQVLWEPAAPEGGRAFTVTLPAVPGPAEPETSGEAADSF